MGETGVGVDTGLSDWDIKGHVVVVHKLESGARIACGVIGSHTGTGLFLRVDSFALYPGYDGPLRVQGSVDIRTESGTATSARQVLSWALDGVGFDCQSGAAED